MMPRRTRPAAAGAAAFRRVLVVTYGTAAGMFAAFAVWGSLFPFTFQPVPLLDVLATFVGPWQAGAPAWSLTDLASNVLLFVPIGLFATAAVESARPAPRSGAVAAPAAVMSAVVLLSLGLELAQACVPWRTPSVVDVIAEGFGAALGIALWRFAREECDALLRFAHDAVCAASRAERWLLMYGAGFAVWWLLPLDFTVRPWEIADKYAHQRLLLPFTPSPDAATAGDLAIAMMAAIPIGVAAAGWACPAGTCRSIARVMLVAVPAGLALEAAQATVFSRNTDATALLAALAGVLAGAFAARTWRGPASEPLDTARLRRWLPVLLFVAAAVACAWYPFHLAVDPAGPARAMASWSRAPFRAPGSALGLLTCMLVAFGGGLAVGGRLRCGFVRLQMIATMVLGAGLFAALESGRLLLEGGRPTLISVCLEWTALLAGLHAGATRSARLSTRRAE